MLAVIDENEPKKIETDLEAALLSLCSYGKPDLSRMRNGWHAHIDMHVASKGAEFKISSEFTHNTPVEAVITLQKRLHETLAKLQ